MATRLKTMLMMIMVILVKVLVNFKNYLLQPWKECEMKVIRWSLDEHFLDLYVINPTTHPPPHPQHLHHHHTTLTQVPRWGSRQCQVPCRPGKVQPCHLPRGVFHIMNHLFICLFIGSYHELFIYLFIHLHLHLHVFISWIIYQGS